MAISVDLYKQLETRASENDRSVSGELANIIKRAIRADKEKKDEN